MGGRTGEGRGEKERWNGEESRGGNGGGQPLHPFGFLSRHRVKMHVLTHLCRNLKNKVKCFELPVAWPGHDMLPGLRSLKATWFINVCAGECKRYIITGDALLKGLLLGEVWRATGVGGGGNWWVGWEDKMLFAMVVAYGCGSVCEFLLVRVGSFWGMIFRGMGGGS